MPQKMGLIVEIVEEPNVIKLEDLSAGDFYMLPDIHDDNVYIYGTGNEDIAVFGSDVGYTSDAEPGDAIIPVEVLGQVKILIKH